jgi:LPXTG-site transpeptidase (sortase) family protein
MHKLLLLVALAAAGCGMAALPGDPLPPIQTSAPVERVAKEPRRRVSVPVRVEIPAIGVDTRLIRLGVDAHGALEVPERFDVAGWWVGGARPGERGPAVITGHVDTKTGPAIFYKLPRLRHGDVVIVHRRDGSRVRFRVTSREHVRKDHFPTAKVYGPTRRPALRLITCSGVFDRSSGHYLDNTVVFASA